MDAPEVAPVPAPSGGADAGAPAAEQPERLTFRERLAAWQYATMERAGMSWPEPVARAAFSAYARAIYHGLPDLRRTVASNLARVIGRPADSPEVLAATHEAFLLYGRYWYEGFHARVMPPEEVNKRFVANGLANIDRALEAGRGAILALPHMGNWDVAGHFLCINGYPLAAVAEQLRPKSVSELFLRHRRELGMRIVPLTADKRAGFEIGELLLQNWIVALVADRDLSGAGVEVEMFGATRKLPAGPALLSIKTGSPLLACSCYTTEEGWVCWIGEPPQVEMTGDTRTDVGTLTRLLATEFERSIAAKPVDWHMFQPAWPDAPPP
ncbi:MAG: phosphatidylinositol mannoside acyltransferase [Actinomycetota bacterium]|nr:phosphatidylinositol mannoside acyltransferase [Actinomycetota bacterium]